MKKMPLFWLASATLTALLLAAATWIALRSTTTAAAKLSTIAAVSPGDVIVNEVAWMGTHADYHDEWIELHNNADEPITFTNWTLAADDGTPFIILSGVISPGGYYLLERSDDTTIKDILADQTYYGALENNPDAEILRLRDAAGTLLDTVNADGGSWPAGDNESKHTMERRDPLADDSDDNWADNDGVTCNGSDAGDNPIYGTPKARNSAYTDPSSHKADLVVDKSGPVTAVAGGMVTYTIRLSNTGTITATDVRLTDSLPTAVTFITHTDSLRFSQDGDLLLWVIGDLAPSSSPLLITFTGQMDAAAYGSVNNVVTATTTATETSTDDNRSNWVTLIDGDPSEARVLIGALLYDGCQIDDRDEAVQLINVGDAPADLAGWKICDALSGGTCASIVSGTLNAKDVAWLAYWASDFYTSFGSIPTYAVKGLTPEISALSGSWPRYANSGEAVVLQDGDGNALDVLIYGEGDTGTHGWNGPAVEAWSNGGLFGVEGQILFRRIDEATGLPVADTDSASDWAQYAADPTLGRRVRYPGWDVEAFFMPIIVTETARVVVGAAPDNAADVVLSAIDAAQKQIEIGVYALRHPTVISELVKKASAGVTVTILLEGDLALVPKTDPRWYQQMWACQRLYDTGHGFCWFMINDDQARIHDRYRYMHAKYLLIDRARVVISTQNLTDRGMPDDDRSNGTHGSRGAVILTDAPSIVARVAQIFDHDLDPLHHADLLAWSPSNSDYGPPPTNFSPVLSVTDYTTYTILLSAPLTLERDFRFELFSAPEASLRQSDALLGLLAQAGDGDQVYVEALDERAHWGANPIDDPSLRMEAYIAAARRGARVRIFRNSGDFDADFYDRDRNITAAAYANAIARQEQLNLIAATGDPTQYGVHSKMVLVWLHGQGGFAHLGSLNGGEVASKANRELAIQIQSDAVYQYLKKVFDWDWHISRPQFLPLVMHQWRPPEPAVGYPLISEVLYDPVGTAEGDEWVEIFNPTGETVDLAGWSLGDVGPAGEYGSGLYSFPPGAVLRAGDVILIARQADDVIDFVPDFEFLIDPLRDDPAVPNMVPVGSWEGFGFALGNTGDEVLLLDSADVLVDGLVYGAGEYAGLVPHPGVDASGHSLERRPAIYDTDDCSRDFFDRFPPNPGGVSSE